MSRSRYRYCPLCREELGEEMRGGRMRLACPRTGCGFVHWDNPIPVVAAIVERDERVVLVRSRGWPDSWYALVTGFLEPDETPEAAVLREVEEEIGIPAELGEYLGAYPFERLNQIIFAYHVRGGPGPIRLCEEELTDYKEVPIAKLKPWPRGTGPALREWLAARGYHPPTVELGEEVPDGRAD
ncbi:MAG: NUDIX domain-containing protein [Gammaproteobacteria bacterium]|nr:NUDIX domain-containing protein [Gammaproteobacteria bacterium]